MAMHSVAQQWVRAFARSLQRLALLGTTSPSIRKGSHLSRRFVEGSHFRAHARQHLERVRAFGEDPERVSAFGHALAEILKRLTLWARIRKRFALLPKFRKGIAPLGMGLLNIGRGSHFSIYVRKGSHYSVFSGLNAKGSPFLNISGTKQKLKTSGVQFRCILASLFLLYCTCLVDREGF